MSIKHLLLIAFLLPAMTLFSCSSQKDSAKQETDELRQEFRDDLTDVRMKIHNLMDEYPENEEVQELMRDFRNYVSDLKGLGEQDKEQLLKNQEKLEEYRQRAAEFDQ